MPSPLDLSTSLNKLAEIVVKDISKGVKRGTPFGKPFKPNEESTIKQKGHSNPLIGKSNTFTKKATYPITKATKTKQVATISIIGGADNIALINQTSKTHPREFYGVSDKAMNSGQKSIDYDINKWVDKEIINMGYKKV